MGFVKMIVLIVSAFIQSFVYITNTIFCLFHNKGCNMAKGGCNLYGTSGCSKEDTCVCRPGYDGDGCQRCLSDTIIISGDNETLNSEGFGTQCSKFIIAL